LSRVIIKHIFSPENLPLLPENNLENWDEVISYFFKNKLEKEEYLVFLENLVKYARQKFCFTSFL
jgi:hypothetical protein